MARSRAVRLTTTIIYNIIKTEICQTYKNVNLTLET